MKILSASLAHPLHRLGLVAAYLSGISGLAYFILKYLATDKAKPDHLIARLPTALVGTPLMSVGLICVGTGVLSVLIALTLRHAAETPPAISAKQSIIRLVCWLPLIFAVILMVREAMPHR